MKVLIFTFIIVIVDQVSKLYIKGISIPKLGIEFAGMPYQSSKSVIGDFFKITFIENPGMAFGLQIGGKLFLSLFTVFATILLFVFLFKNRHETLLLRLALAFILGGAIGNLIDRVFYGKIYGYAPYFYGRVVDFLHFDFPNFTIFGKTIYSYPIFNVADIAVSVGFLMILFGYRKIFRKEDQDEILSDIHPVPLNESLVVITDEETEKGPDNFSEGKINPDGYSNDFLNNKTVDPETGSEIDNSDFGKPN